LRSRSAGEKFQATIPKITKARRAGAVAQVVELLLSRHKVVSSNPSTIKKGKKKKNQHNKGRTEMQFPY
jgi:hypothetical protein